jgi:type II restriction/modification system DNA methylase subunit YeeA
MKIHNVIYIYSKYGQVNGNKQTPIEDSETSYDHISMLFNSTNRDKYYKPKLHQMLKAWALDGLYVFP